MWDDPDRRAWRRASRRRWVAMAIIVAAAAAVSTALATLAHRAPAILLAPRYVALAPLAAAAAGCAVYELAARRDPSLALGEGTWRPTADWALVALALSVLFLVGVAGASGTFVAGVILAAIVALAARGTQLVMARAKADAHPRRSDREMLAGGVRRPGRTPPAPAPIPIRPERDPLTADTCSRRWAPPRPEDGRHERAPVEPSRLDSPASHAAEAHQRARPAPQRPASAPPTRKRRRRPRQPARPAAVAGPSAPDVTTAAALLDTPWRDAVPAPALAEIAPLAAAPTPPLAAEDVHAALLAASHAAQATPAPTPPPDRPLPVPAAEPPAHPSPYRIARQSLAQARRQLRAGRVRRVHLAHETGPRGEPVVLLRAAGRTDCVLTGPTIDLYDMLEVAAAAAAIVDAPAVVELAVVAPPDQPSTWIVSYRCGPAEAVRHVVRLAERLDLSLTLAPRPVLEAYAGGLVAQVSRRLTVAQRAAGGPVCAPIECVTGPTGDGGLADLVVAAAVALSIAQRPAVLAAGCEPGRPPTTAVCTWPDTSWAPDTDDEALIDELVIARERLSVAMTIGGVTTTPLDVREPLAERVTRLAVLA